MASDVSSRGCLSPLSCVSVGWGRGSFSIMAMILCLRWSFQLIKLLWLALFGFTACHCGESNWVRKNLLLERLQRRMTNWCYSTNALGDTETSETILMRFGDEYWEMIKKGALIFYHESHIHYSSVLIPACRSPPAHPPVILLFLCSSPKSAQFHSATSTQNDSCLEQYSCIWSGPAFWYQRYLCPVGCEWGNRIHAQYTDGNFFFPLFFLLCLTLSTSHFCPSLFQFSSSHHLPTLSPLLHLCILSPSIQPWAGGPLWHFLPSNMGEGGRQPQPAVHLHLSSVALPAGCHLVQRW